MCVWRSADTVPRYDLTGEHPEWKINLACNAMKCGQLVGGLYSAHIRLPLQMNRIISGARAIRSRQLFADCAKCLALRRKLLLTQIFIEEIQFKHERKYKHYIVIWHGTKCFVFHTLVTWFPPAISSLSLSRYRLCVYIDVYMYLCVYIDFAVVALRPRFMPLSVCQLLFYSWAKIENFRHAETTVHGMCIVHSLTTLCDYRISALSDRTNYYYWIFTKKHRK